jgi:hypothetical protein
MPPLSQRETAAYLRHRLAVAGFDGTSPFAAARIRAIHRTSGGLPGRIGSQAHEFLKRNFSEKEHQPGLIPAAWRRRLQSPYMVAAGVVILIAATTLIFQLFLKRPQAPEERSLAEVRPQGTGQFRDASVVKLPIHPSPKPGRTVQEALPPAGVEKSNGERPYVAKVEKGDGALSPASGTESERWRLPSPSPIEEKGIHGESWLLAQNSSHYTLQLLAARKKESLLRFVETHRLQNQVACYLSYGEQSQWYPLLYGIYSTHNQALAALEELPREIRGYEPWIRRLSSVQEAIIKVRRQGQPNNPG